LFKPLPFRKNGMAVTPDGVLEVDVFPVESDELAHASIVHKWQSFIVDEFVLVDCLVIWQE
jgi:hypothetical protein